MTGRWFGFTLLLAPWSLAAQLALPYRLAVTPDVSMRIWVPSGTVRVDTWDRDSIRITGTVGPASRFFAGGTGRAAKLGVESVDLKQTALPSADLVVTVPRQAHVWIKMTDGRVTAAHTAGELEVITVTGTITVQDAAGVVSVETIDAGVSLARITGDVRVRSGGGRITLAGIDATLTAATVGGAIDLTGSSMQDGRLETIGGAITVRGTVATEALLELETHSGPITLVVDPASMPMLGLSSRAGTVRNPLTKVKGITSGRITAHSFKGDVNVVVGRGIEGGKVITPP